MFFIMPSLHKWVHPTEQIGGASLSIMSYEVSDSNIL